MTTIMPETETTITSVVTEEQTPVPGNKEPDKRHIVFGQLNPPVNTHIWRPGMSGQDMLDIAMVRGVEITALCGFKWIPQRGGPATTGLETCDVCMDIAGKMAG